MTLLQNFSILDGSILIHKLTLSIKGQKHFGDNLHLMLFTCVPDSCIIGINQILGKDTSTKAIQWNLSAAEHSTQDVYTQIKI